MLLIVLRNLVKGVVLSIFFALFPLSDLCQSRFHSLFSSSLHFLITADGLMSK